MTSRRGPRHGANRVVVRRWPRPRPGSTIPHHHGSRLSELRPRQVRHSHGNTSGERTTHPAPDPPPGSPQPRRQARCTCLNTTPPAPRFAPRQVAPGGPPGGPEPTHSRERGRGAACMSGHERENCKHREMRSHERGAVTCPEPGCGTESPHPPWLPLPFPRSAPRSPTHRPVPRSHPHVVVAEGMRNRQPCSHHECRYAHLAST